MVRRIAHKRKEEAWTGSTKGPRVVEWPRNWYPHPKDRDCLYADLRDESVVVKLGGEMVNCFWHFWCGPNHGTCSSCKCKHPTTSFDGTTYFGKSFGLFRSEDPREAQGPIGVYCRDCAHALWEASERFLDGFDRAAGLE